MCRYPRPRRVERRWPIRRSEEQAALAAEAFLKLPAGCRCLSAKAPPAADRWEGQVAFAAAATGGRHACGDGAANRCGGCGRIAADVVRGGVVNPHRRAGGSASGINRFSDLLAGGRGAFSFSAPKDGAVSERDVVIDLTGDPALVPAPHKRDTATARRSTPACRRWHNAVRSGATGRHVRKTALYRAGTRALRP